MLRTLSDVLGRSNSHGAQAVKKIVTKNLARHGITKTHADFKEIFNMCYYGASFALVNFHAVVLYSC